MEQQVLLVREVMTEQETWIFAAQTVRYFKANDTILLYGELGSGKTFLVKEFVRLLGCRSQANSPSFTILNQYSGEYPVNHIDLYRISGLQEIDNLGLDDLWEGGAITFIEWPDLIERMITWTHYRIGIDINYTAESWRRFTLSRYGR
jgi:tRNA threonylcarbamoyladenosine biosynthesis protein TsaE